MANDIKSVEKEVNNFTNKVKDTISQIKVSPETKLRIWVNIKKQLRGVKQ